MKLTGWQKVVLAVAGLGAVLVVLGYLSGADWAALVGRMLPAIGA